MTKIDMSEFIEGLRMVRRDLSIERHYSAEYIYHLISVLMESQKLINGEFFAPDYIEEHCLTLYRYAYQVRDEEERNANR